MYLEFFILYFDYFRTLKKRIVLFEWGIPFVFSILIFLAVRINNSTSCFLNYRDNIIALFGVLIGFSITIITLLITSNNTNIDNLKSKLTEYNLGTKKLTLFELLIMNFTYLIITQIFLIMANLFFPVINALFNFSFFSKILFFSIDALFITHVLLLNVRNVCDLYFVLVNNQKSKPKQ